MTSRFAVLGPGGVGGFVAAALSRAGQRVEVIARDSTAAAIGADGIQVRSQVLGDFVARPAAVTVLREPVDVLFVASKATGLADALDRVEVAPALIVPLLNGLDHLAVLRERFEAAAVAAAVIRVESDRPVPGQIIQTSPSVRIDMAAQSPDTAARLPPVAAALSAAGIPALIGESEAEVMWSKLVRLNALSATTTVSGRSIGAIRSDPEWRRVLEACVAEAAATATADGAPIDPATTMRELDSAHPGLGSSMQRDLAAGREPELDAIQGSVIRAAARHGVACPTVTRLAAEIAALAQIDPPRMG
jgi:2-dehydropantoate 2-reductase